jgi:ascorbate-specific PTS system EIIC-type component UlaA
MVYFGEIAAYNVKSQQQKSQEKLKFSKVGDIFSSKTVTTLWMVALFYNKNNNNNRFTGEHEFL